MHSPLPHVPQRAAPVEHPAPQEASPQTCPDLEDSDPRFTTELARALSGARRRAHRDGDRHTDTAHLLHALLETDPGVRAAFDGDPQVARVLGYLVQRSIGYGLRWQGTVEHSAGVAPVCGQVGAGWSPSAATAMLSALERAALRGGDRACGLDLLRALASDPGCRAVHVLEQAGVDPQLLAGRLSCPSRPGLRRT